MKTIILAGGLGTRLSELTELRPKPMAEIGGKPILWHIMKCYSQYGHNDFIILLGYKGYLIKEYFINYYNHNSDIQIDLSNNNIQILNNESENWKITLLDTGMETLTGGRISFAQKYTQNEPFMCTYGDGVSNVDFNKLIDFHKKNKKLMTLTAIQPEAKYGALEFSDNEIIKSFKEKPPGDSSWRNGGFFVCQPEVYNYIKSDLMFESDPMENLAKDGQLIAYKHSGFWQSMDTLRDYKKLNGIWNGNDIPWKTW